MAESAFSSTLAKHESGLVATCAAEMEARAALNGFRSRNGIHDPARYPEDRLFHFSLLILFIVIETGVNTSFYQSASGMIGSAVIALSVSVYGPVVDRTPPRQTPAPMALMGAGLIIFAICPVSWSGKSA